jgi:wyosine [tRNA(Phe)-imidazoG37] synthetase (radical SAM superfamily)
MRTQGEKPDVITYAGNGEPTMHPEFHGIIDDSVALRNEFFPEAKISVLSNATGINRKSVRDALMKVDMNILKLDSVFMSTVSVLNRPQKSYNLAQVIENMKLFNGKFIIQTLFVRGEHEGKTVDNTTPEEVNAWLEKVMELNPESVMIYTIERDTPLGKKLHKVPLADLKAIAARVEAAGITASVSG